MSSVWKIAGFFCSVNTEVCAHTSETPIIKQGDKADKQLVRAEESAAPAAPAALLSHGKSQGKVTLRAGLLCNGLGYISTARETLGESQ